MTHTNLYKILTYSGSAPFVVCAVLHLLGYTELPLLGDVKDVALVYGLVIISFMAGTHWGLYLYQSDKTSLNLFMTSNIITLAVWFVYLFGSMLFKFLALIIAFISLLVIDFKLIDDDMIDLEYYRTRIFVTAIVVFSLLILLG